MASIQVLSQSIEYINSNKYFIKFDIQTNVKPNASFNLTVNHKKPVNLIVSPYIYNGFQSDICQRTNANEHDVIIYGFHGGKELSRVLPGLNKMGNVTYPDIGYSLLSQIVFPNPESNSHYILAIDSLPALSTIEHEQLRTQLFEQDTTVFIENLSKFSQAALSIGSTIQLVILKESSVLSEFLLSASSFQISRIESSKMVRYLGDVVFGRVFGGTQSDFSTILSLSGSNSNSKVSLVTAFSQVMSDSEFQHKIIIRSSGVVISGNTTSSIGMIIEADSTDIIKVFDVNSGMEVCCFDCTSVPIHTEVSRLGEYIKLIEYTNVLQKIDSNDKDKTKIHMSSCREFIEEIEYSEYDDLVVLEDKFSLTINKQILHGLKIIKAKWYDIRSKFGYNNKSSNKSFTGRGQNIDFSNELEFSFPPGFEYTPGIHSVPIATRQYTQCLDKKLTFDDL